MNGTEGFREYVLLICPKMRRRMTGSAAALLSQRPRDGAEPTGSTRKSEMPSVICGQARVKEGKQGDSGLHSCRGLCTW